MAEDDSTPLPAPQIRAMLAKFKGNHGFVFLPWQLASDSTRSRFRREFEKRPLSVADLSRIKRLLEVQRVPLTKKTKLAPGLHLNQTEREEDSSGWGSSGGLFILLSNIELSMDSYADVGTLEFVAEGTNEKEAYCAYPDCREYHGRMVLAATRVLSTGQPEDLVVEAIKSVDMAFCSKWVELVRASPSKVSLSKAVTATLSTYEPLFVWESTPYIAPPMHRGTGEVAVPPSGFGGGGGKGSNGGSSSKKKGAGLQPPQDGVVPMTGDMWQGIKICKPHADVRSGIGCKWGGQCELQHCCDVLAAKDIVCGPRTQQRPDHDGPVYQWVKSRFRF